MKEKKWMLSDSEYGELNPPLENMRMIKNEIWYQWVDDPKWLHVGYIPCPTNALGWFFYHFIHGVWMKYPLWAIILYCFDTDNYPSRKAVEHTHALDAAKPCANCGHHKNAHWHRDCGGAYEFADCGGVNDDVCDCKKYKSVL